MPTDPRVLTSDDISPVGGIGLVSALGDGTSIARAIVGVAQRIEVLRGNGVGGNPQIDLAPSFVDYIETIASALGELEASFQAHLETALTLSQIGTAVQAHDADLAAIAALTTQTFGRSLLTAASSAALRTLAGTVIGTDVQAYDADLAAIAALSTQAYGRSLLTLADEAALKALINFSALKVVEFSGSALTITSDHAGAMILMSNSSDITVTLPATMPKNFAVSLVQWDIGTIVLTPGSGNPLHITHTLGHVRSDGNTGSILSLGVVQNVDGNTARWLLTGNTGT